MNAELALRCLAVEPGLDGLLLFDAAPDLMPAMGERLGSLCGTGRIVVLGSTTTEEQLWGRRTVGAGLRYVPGPLIELDATTIVLVPDLATVSQPVTRAAVTLVGAGVGHLERDGSSVAFAPRVKWLVGCSRADIGRLSPHLLDRFPFRTGGGVPASVPVGAPGPAVDRSPSAGDGSESVGGGAETLGEGSAAGPPFADAAIERIFRWLPGPVPGARRHLALGRVARALARLDAGPAVTADNVDAAAALMGLRAPAAASPARPAEPLPTPAPVTRAARTRRRPAGEAVVVDAGQPVVAPGPADELAVIELPGAGDVLEAYPEDAVEAGGSPDTLRIPWQRRSGTSRLRGVAVGVEPARDLTDLAVVATIVEATKFQPVRRQAVADPPDRLLISPNDLRAYRRLPEPSRLLVLVLDHTAHRGWNWIPPLAPYLRWAYVERAAICVVEAGARDARDELRAQWFGALNLRDPRVDAALKRPIGRATPLAHALHVAAQELRRRLQHGRAMVEQAWLVVVSDGRGNVPLAASLAGSITGPVGREGVDDALAAAQPISAMGQVRTVVIDPGRGPYRSFVFDLADALGGVVERGRD